MRVSAETARRFLIARHLLAPARSLEGGRDGVLEVFRRFGSIQFDPIDVAGRTHDLMLRARVAGYDPAWCDELYERREIFEAYNKGLSFVLASEFPWFRAQLRATPPSVIAENPEVAERVLERIRAEGPLSSRDFERERGTTTDWFGMPTNTVRALLEASAAEGTSSAASARRRPTRGGRGIRAEPRSARNSSRTATSFPSRSRACAASASSSATRSDCSKHRRSRRPRSRSSSRRSIRWSGTAASSGSLFEFDYVWELFHPPAKRRWGWYVLPILFRDQFVGRIEPRIDRAAGRVQVLGLWWEEGFEPKRAHGFVDAMHDALAAYVRFAGANSTEWASHLDQERRLFDRRR